MDTEHNDTFNFDTEFEFKVLALCVRDNDFLNIYKTVLKAEFFTSTENYLIASSILSYCERYSSVCDRADLRESIRRKGEKTKNEKAALVAIDSLEILYTLPIEEAAMAGDMVLEFIEQNVMAKAVIECAEILDDEKVPNRKQMVREKIEEAYKFTDVLTQKGLKMIDFVEAQVDYLLKPASEKKVVPTGFPHLDKVLRGGGLGAGHLAELQGPQKRFKSGLLANFAYHAARAPHNKNVVIYTMELSEEEYVSRLNCRTAKMSEEEIVKDPERFKKTVKSKLTNGLMGGQILVVYFEAENTKVDDLRSHCDALKKSGFSPDLIIIDYLDLLAPPRRLGPQGRRFEIDTIYRLTKIWAKKDELAIWTAGQSKGSASRSKIVTEEDSSESKGKTRIVDLQVTICQTPQEYARNEMRLHIPVHRHGEQWGFVKVKTDPKMYYAKSLEYIKPSAEDVEEEDKPVRRKLGRGNKPDKPTEPDNDIV